MRPWTAVLVLSGCAHLGPSAPATWPPDWHNLQATYWAGLGLDHKAPAFSRRLELGVPRSVRLDMHSPPLSGRCRWEGRLRPKLLVEDLLAALDLVDRQVVRTGVDVKIQDRVRAVYLARFQSVLGHAVPTVITVEHLDPSISYSVRFHLRSADVE